MLKSVGGATAIRESVVIAAQQSSDERAPASAQHAILWRKSHGAAYHRTDLLEQRRPLMEAWAQHFYLRVTRLTILPRPDVEK